MPLPAIPAPPLTLRPFSPADAPRVAKLAGHPAIADTTLRIPHPYSMEDANKWLATHAPAFAAGEGVALAMEPAPNAPLVGCVGISVDKAANEAELGYWVGQPHWSNGYATAAAKALVAWAFSAWRLARIHACHFARNPQSGKVMENIGMSRQPAQGKFVCKAGCEEEVVLYEIFPPQSPS